MREAGKYITNNEQVSDKPTIRHMSQNLLIESAIKY